MNESPWIVVHTEKTCFHTHVVRETGLADEYLHTDGTVHGNTMGGWFCSVEHADRAIAEYEANTE